MSGAPSGPALLHSLPFPSRLPVFPLVSFSFPPFFTPTLLFSYSPSAITQKHPPHTLTLYSYSLRSPCLVRPHHKHTNRSCLGFSPPPHRFVSAFLPSCPRERGGLSKPTHASKFTFYFLYFCEHLFYFIQHKSI